MKYYFIILILFFSSLGISSTAFSTEVNFFVNYNFITFSSFDNFIKNKTEDLNLYLEYNPLIIIYLNWNKNPLIENLKEMIGQKQIKLFKIGDPQPSSLPSEKWFLNLQKEADNKLFSIVKEQPDILNLKNPEISIKILNLKEMDSILKTISEKGIKDKLNFKLDLSLLLYDKISSFFSILQKYKNLKLNLYIISDFRYSASKKEIKDLMNLIYMIKDRKKLNNYENKILDLTTILFSVKLFDQTSDLMLNLYSLTTNFKKNMVTEKKYRILTNSYITLNDGDNFIVFDAKTGYLKKWLLLSKGESLINFDSFMEQLYINDKKTWIPLNIKEIKTIEFPNGSIFNYTLDNSIQIEKNVILQNKNLSLTYNIINNSKKTRGFIFIMENKYSPSLLDSLTNPANKFAFCAYNRNYSSQYNNDVNGFINLNTGCGISWNYYTIPKGIEFFKNFYCFTKKCYYKFNLYPKEQKVITVSYQTRYVSDKLRTPFMQNSSPVTNQYFGDFSIR